VGLAIIIMTARNRQSLNVERVDLLKSKCSYLNICGSFRCSRCSAGDQRSVGAKWPNKFVNTVALSSTGISFVFAVEAVREFLGYYAQTQHAFRKEFFDWIVAAIFARASICRWTSSRSSWSWWSLASAF